MSRIFRICLLSIFSCSIFSSSLTEQSSEGCFIDYLSTLSQEEKAQICDIFSDTALELKQSILLLFLLPVRCSGCKKVEKRLKTALKKKELSPLIQMYTFSRWSHCLVHNPKLTRKNKDNFCPVLIAIHTATHKQIFKQEITKTKGFSKNFFNGVIASACN